MDINLVIKDVSALSLRVSALEKGFNDMNDKIKTVERETVEAKLYAHKAADASAEAVVLLSAAKGLGGFVAKHGPRVVAGIVGVMAYKGLIDTNLASQVAQIFVP